MRQLTADRQLWTLGVLVIATAYSIALGEGLYLFSLLLTLLCVVFAASIFSRLVTAVTVAASTLIAAYFVVPPVFSFHMVGRELQFFLLYFTAALVGSVVAQVRRQRLRATLESEFPELTQETRNLVLACNTDCRLLAVNAATLAFTGKRRDQLSGFLWLARIVPDDRDRLVAAVRHGAGELTCHFLNAAGITNSFHVSIRSRLWTAAKNAGLGSLFHRTVILIFKEVAE